jgi:hypothetical protein
MPTTSPLAETISTLVPTPTAPDPAGTAAASPHTGTYKGFLESANRTTIEGWAFDEGRPDVTVQVILFDGDTRIGVAAADRFRPDLLAAGIGDGNHAFRFSTPPSLKDGEVHTISAKIADADVTLRGGPKLITGED